MSSKCRRPWMLTSISNDRGGKPKKQSQIQYEEDTEIMLVKQTTKAHPLPYSLGRTDTPASLLGLCDLWIISPLNITFRLADICDLDQAGKRSVLWILCVRRTPSLPCVSSPNTLSTASILLDRHDTFCRRNHTSRPHEFDTTLELG